MLVQLVNTSVRVGSREKCRFQWLSEQGQRCWRTDCFRKAVPNWSHGSRESPVTNGGSNSPWPVQWTTRNEVAATCRHQRLAAVVWIGSWQGDGHAACNTRLLKQSSMQQFWPHVILVAVIDWSRIEAHVVARVKIHLLCHSALVAFSALTLLVGRQEGHPARKKIWGDGVGGHWLVRMEWRPAGWSVFLPLLILPCTIKSRSSLLAPADPGGPGKRAVKRLHCHRAAAGADINCSGCMYLSMCIHW